MKNNSYLRNLEEKYNTRNLFNSTSNPISLVNTVFLNISNMIENLNDDTNNFIDMNKNDKIKSKYELIKTDLDLFDNILQANKYLFKENLLDISLSNSTINLTMNYLENCILTVIEERKASNKFIISIVDNKIIKCLNKISTGILLSIYNFYSNLINEQSQVITSDDIQINNYYLNNINDTKTVIEIINNKKIFSKSKELIKSNAKRMIIEIDNLMEFNETEYIDEINDFEFSKRNPDLKYSKIISDSSLELDII